jgi:tRNA A-37 threonylcarbamoyl transferase component Bud32
MKKIFRECSAFARKADRTMVLVYDKHYGSEGFQELYRNPDGVFANAQGDYLKRGNTSTVIRTTVDGVEVVVKRYNIKDAWHGMKRALQRTRASISWQNANLMRFYGIDTPRPIAFIEKRTGPARRTSYFISEYVSGPSYRQYFAAETASQESRNQLADKIADMLATLARYRLGHGDMKATNLIIVDGNPYLIDLDGMRQYKSAAGFARAHQRDIQRFLKNWADQPDVRALFAQEIARHVPRGQNLV